MRSERWGIALGVLGLGATLLTAALALGDVKMPDYLLWTMGLGGALLMVAGLAMLLLRRAPARKSGEPDVAVNLSQWPPSSFPPGYIDLPEP